MYGRYYKTQRNYMYLHIQLVLEEFSFLDWFPSKFKPIVTTVSNFMAKSNIHFSSLQDHIHLQPLRTTGRIERSLNSLIHSNPNTPKTSFSVIYTSNNCKTRNMFPLLWLVYSSVTSSSPETSFAVLRVPIPNNGFHISCMCNRPKICRTSYRPSLLKTVEEL